MKFVRNTIDLVSDLLLRPNTGRRIFDEGLSAVSEPVKNVISGKALRSVSDFGSNLLSLPLQTGLGAAFIYPSLKWNRPDLDSSGPLEETASRAMGLYMGGVASAASPFRKGILPGIAGLVGASLLGESVAKHVGRGADSLAGMRPSPEELNMRFMDRLNPRANQIKTMQPTITDDDSMRMALGEILQEYPSYLDDMGIK